MTIGPNPFVIAADLLFPEPNLYVFRHHLQARFGLGGEADQRVRHAGLHGEQVPPGLLPLLVSPEWVEERKKRWGVNSPIYQSKVLGEFPDISDAP